MTSISENSRPAKRPPGLLDALGVQMNVIGALIMRELHTRFGRDNIGYLWVFAEPMLLAIAVAAMHAGNGCMIQEIYPDAHNTMILVCK